MIEPLSKPAGPWLTVGANASVIVTCFVAMMTIVWGAGRFAEKMNNIETAVIQHAVLPAHGDMRPRVSVIEAEIRALVSLMQRHENDHHGGQRGR